jgi:uncharacterized membrane protein YjfL (UPF0719 family)
MDTLKGYGLTIVWMVAFLVLAFVAHWLFDRLTPFPLRQASDRKNPAVGHVLRGLYVGLAIILLAAIRGNRNLAWGVLDGAIGVFLVLLTYVAFDRFDPRNFGQELGDGNTMLAMEIEGLFIMTAAVVAGAMNLPLP